MSAVGIAKGSQVNKLTLDLMLRLVDYVRANFVQSEMSEKDFAVKAGNELGFPVGMSNVNSARVALGLPSYRKLVIAQAQAKRDAKKSGVPTDTSTNLILDELHALNQGIAMLSAKLDRLLK